jgi:hypothetical protein
MSQLVYSYKLLEEPQEELLVELQAARLVELRAELRAELQVELQVEPQEELQEELQEEPQEARLV